VTFFAALLLLTGCKKEESSPTSTPTTTQPTTPSISFQGPNTQSSNQYAQLAKSNAQVINGYSSSFLAFSSLPGTQNGNVWTYTIDVPGQYSETITATQNADGSVSWKFSFNGSFGGVSVTNWVYLEGTTNADGKSGNLKFYETGKTVVQFEITWATDSQGLETGTYYIYSAGVLQSRVEMTNKTDGAGSMKIYTKKQNATALFLSMDINWLANGTGTYDLYDEAGNKTSGNW
jgi:hypothetical protein